MDMCAKRPFLGEKLRYFFLKNVSCIFMAEII